jgi:hypothetical protein
VNQTEAAMPLFKTALNARPSQGQFWLSYIDALKKAKSFADAPFFFSMNPAHPMPSNIELADLYRYADLIPGMCEDERFHVLLKIACHSVKGDIVEIGSWWGKSAFILA